MKIKNQEQISVYHQYTLFGDCQPQGSSNNLQGLIDVAEMLLGRGEFNKVRILDQNHKTVFLAPW